MEGSRTPTAMASSRSALASGNRRSRLRESVVPNPASTSNRSASGAVFPMRRRLASVSSYRATAPAESPSCSAISPSQYNAQSLCTGALELHQSGIAGSQAQAQRALRGGVARPTLLQARRSQIQHLRYGERFGVQTLAAGREQNVVEQLIHRLRLG